jgi:hypothetical protein
MTLATTVQAMAASGCSPEQIATVVAAHEAEAETKRAAKREKNAVRMRLYRKLHPADVTRRSAHVRAQTRSDAHPSLKESVPPAPPLKENTPSLFLASANAESSPRSEKTNDFNELVDWFEGQWNNLAAACGLPKIQAMTDARITHIRRRADDLVKALHFPDPQAGFTDTFNRIRGSPWLRGANGRAWKCDVDWILAESHFLQIHEGKYEKDQRSSLARR